jgi:hypothetical protein
MKACTVSNKTFEYWILCHDVCKSARNFIYLTTTTKISIVKKNQLMLFRAIFIACSENLRTQYKLCKQNLGHTRLRRLLITALQEGSTHKGVIQNFQLTSFFRSKYGPGIDLASKRNEYQENVLVSKGGRCLTLTVLPS